MNSLAFSLKENESKVAHSSIPLQLKWSPSYQSFLDKIDITNIEQKIIGFSSMGYPRSQKKLWLSFHKTLIESGVSQKNCVLYFGHDPVLDHLISHSKKREITRGENKIVFHECEGELLILDLNLLVSFFEGMDEFSTRSIFDNILKECQKCFIDIPKLSEVKSNPNLHIILSHIKKIFIISRRNLDSKSELDNLKNYFSKFNLETDLI